MDDSLDRGERDDNSFILQNRMHDYRAAPYGETLCDDSRSKIFRESLWRLLGSARYGINRLSMTPFHYCALGVSEMTSDLSGAPSLF